MTRTLGTAHDHDQAHGYTRLITGRNGRCPAHAAPWLLPAEDKQRVDRFGYANGSMFMILAGLDHQGRPLRENWFIVAEAGQGPHIPTIPANIFARKAARCQLKLKGTCPCVDLVTLEEYLFELKPYPIETFTE